jgi:hypothetical protein
MWLCAAKCVPSSETVGGRSVTFERVLIVPYPVESGASPGEKSAATDRCGLGGANEYGRAMHNKTTRKRRRYKADTEVFESGKEGVGMCGIVGVASVPAWSERSALGELRDTMSHRGPDDAGEWWSRDGRVGFRRDRTSIDGPGPRCDRSCGGVRCQAGESPIGSTPVRELKRRCSALLEQRSCFTWAMTSS